MFTICDIVGTSYILFLDLGSTPICRRSYVSTRNYCSLHEFSLLWLSQTRRTVSNILGLLVIWGANGRRKSQPLGPLDARNLDLLRIHYVKIHRLCQDSILADSSTLPTFHFVGAHLIDPFSYLFVLWLDNRLSVCLYLMIDGPY